MQNESKNSLDLFDQLVGMGFSVDSIQRGFLELGNQIRPELLVAWLLEHPNVEVSYFVFTCSNICYF